MPYCNLIINIHRRQIIQITYRNDSCLFGSFKFQVTQNLNFQKHLTLQDESDWLLFRLKVKSKK